MLVLGLVVISTFYLGLCFYTDLRSYEIYVFPARILSILWIIHLANSINPIYLISFILIHLLICIMFDHFKIWGGGDSEFLFLFALICLSSVGEIGTCGEAFIELSAFAIGVFLSVIMGIVKCLIFHEDT